MKQKYAILIIAFTVTAILLSFTKDNNPYFVITKKDIELNIPKSFPKPVYNFKQNKLTPEGFVLGRKLFYDPILSKDSSVNCAFCHQRFAAFAHIDHQLSHGIDGKIGKRNVPAIQNMIWEKDFMWDGGINHLEVQPTAPITNAVEMNESLEHVISKLSKRQDYIESFRLAFKDTVINTQRMLRALAQFTGSMISCNSKYDKYMAGKDTLSTTELHGLKVFRNRCSNCHKEPLFTDNGFHNIGLMPDTVLKDFGRVNVTGIDSDYMKFKTPSLRNVELTYPYMHDGRFRNLNQVLNHYSTGNFFTENFDKLIMQTVKLSEIEKADLIAFMKTLTDKEFLYDRRFADPNHR